SVREISDFDFACEFTSDGEYVMFGSTPFKIVDNELVELPPTSEQLRIGGAFENVFYATNEQQELVRFDPATGATEVVIAVDVLEEHCSTEIAPPTIQLYLPQDRRGIGLVRVSCSSVDEYEGGSI